MRTLIQGVGINDYQGVVREQLPNGKSKLKSFYVAWTNMLTRAYSANYHKLYPSYIGCSVCDEWHSLTNFKKWYDRFYKEGYALDKDLLKEGNKVYCPTLCRFIPKEINALFLGSNRSRGKYLQGVSKENNVYRSNLRINSKLKDLGSYLTEVDASEAYLRAKASYAKEVLDVENVFTAEEKLSVYTQQMNKLLELHNKKFKKGLTLRF